MKDTKKCKGCGVEKTLDNYNKHNMTKDKLFNKCKDCYKCYRKKGKGKNDYPRKEREYTHENIMEEITEYVSFSNGTTPEIVRGKSRKREDALTRQLCMWVLYRCTNLTNKKIGIYYDRHHSSVIHSVREIEDMLTMTDPISIRNQKYIKEVRLHFDLGPSVLVKC
jgi:hypothetical protein